MNQFDVTYESLPYIILKILHIIRKSCLYYSQILPILFSNPAYYYQIMPKLLSNYAYSSQIMPAYSLNPNQEESYPSVWSSLYRPRSVFRCLSSAVCPLVCQPDQLSIGLVSRPWSVHFRTCEWSVISASMCGL